mgnify:CR=1 FL=1
MRAQAGLEARLAAGPDDRIVQPDHARWVARTRAGLEPVVLDADHSPFLSAPDSLARLAIWEARTSSMLTSPPSPNSANSSGDRTALSLAAALSARVSWMNRNDMPSATINTTAATLSTI